MNMNFNAEGPSCIPPFSSNDDPSSIDSEELEAEEEGIIRAIHNNNMMITKLLNQKNKERRHRGSVPGRVVINRDRETADQNLFNDYFSENPCYNDVMFRRRFRMSRSLFLRIVDAVKQHDNYFRQRHDALGRTGLSTLQKVTAVFRMLAYGVPADAIDEYIKIGESTTIESMKRFCRAVIEIFANRYLRSPTASDIAQLLYIGEQLVFSRMLGSLDCMHWKWKKYPTAWAEQYTGRSGNPSIILEAVADYDIWI